MANQINSIILEGNLVRDMEVVKVSDTFRVGKFTIAVSRTYRKADDTEEEEVSYFDIECFGKMADVLENKLKKGREIRVVGRLKQERWKSDKGTLSAKVYIVAEHVEVKPQKKEGVEK